MTQKRHFPLVAITLRPEVLRRLGILSRLWGTSRSGTLSRLVLEASVPETEGGEEELDSPGRTSYKKEGG